MAPAAGCVVVGAGIAGLMAARRVADAGVDVAVLEARERVGGRMATRSVAGPRGVATFDVGAQFFTVRDERFGEVAGRWLDRGLARVWFEGRPDAGTGRGRGGESGGGEPHLCGTAGMQALCEDLAAGLDVVTGASVRSLTLRAGTWSLTTAGGGTRHAAAVVLAVPLPVARGLVGEGDAALDAAWQRHVGDVDYDPCIAALAVPGDAVSTAPHVGNAGALRVGGEPVEWVGDNLAKGISGAPAVTVHAGPAASREWWDEHDAVAGRLLAGAARRWLGVPLHAVAVHRWPYSKPQRPVGGRDAGLLRERPPLVVAGDALPGGRVEGAAVSGLAAADDVVRLLSA